MQRWLSCPKHLKFSVKFKCIWSPFCLVMVLPLFSSVVEQSSSVGSLVVSESFGRNGWKMRMWLAEVPVFSRELVDSEDPVFSCATFCCCLPWGSALSVTMPGLCWDHAAYTPRLGGSRCALHTAPRLNEPVCTGLPIPDCVESCKIRMMSHGHLPIQAISHVPE